MDPDIWETKRASSKTGSEEIAAESGSATLQHGVENGLTLYINMLLTISELNLPDSGSVVLNQGCIISGKSYFNVQQRLNISKSCNTLMNVIL